MINAQPKKTKEDRKKEKATRKRVKKKVVKKKVKKPVLGKEKIKCDRIMSIYIRLRDCLDTTNTVDRGKCFTCDTEYDFADLQNGHFISRRFNATRMDESNCNIQCFNCNMTKGGNYIEYTLRMIEQRGRGSIDVLKEKSKEPSKYKAIDFVEMQYSFVHKIEEMTGFVYKWQRVEGKSYYKWVRLDDSGKI